MSPAPRRDRRNIRSPTSRCATASARRTTRSRCGSTSPSTVSIAFGIVYSIYYLVRRAGPPPGSGPPRWRWHEEKYAAVRAAMPMDNPVSRRRRRLIAEGKPRPSPVDLRRHVIKPDGSRSGGAEPRRSRTGSTATTTRRSTCRSPRAVRSACLAWEKPARQRTRSGRSLAYMETLPDDARQPGVGSPELRATRPQRVS